MCTPTDMCVQVQPPLVHISDSSQICASILGTEWSPVLSVSAVCVTLQSMLASCKVTSATIIL